ADLLYLLGVTCSRLRKTTNAIYYIKNALNFYQMNYNVKRCSQCHLALGISYRRIKEYDKAEKQFKQALEIAQSIKDNELIILIFMNFGHLYSVKEESEDALKFFNKAISYTHDIYIEEK